MCQPAADAAYISQSLKELATRLNPWEERLSIAAAFWFFFRILVCQELYSYTHLGVQSEIQRKRRSNLLLAEGFALPPMGEEHFKKTLYSVYIVKYSSDETHTIYKINTNTYIAGFQNNTEHYTVTDVKRIRQYDSQRNTWYCALCVMLKTRNV